MAEPTQDTQIVDQSPAVPAAAAMGLSPSSTPFPASSDTMRVQYDASVARRRAHPEHDTGPRGSGQEANRGVETFDQWKERMYPAPIPADSGAAPVAGPQVTGTGRPPTGIAAGPRGGGGNTKQAVQQAIAEEWHNAGYSDAAIKGIMRRVGVESGFNSFALGDYVNGEPTSLGPYQHHDVRATKLAQFLQANGARDGSDPVKTARLATQFAISEMNGGDPIAAKSRDELMHSTDPNQAYGLFTSAFERPKGSPGSEETNLKSTAMGPFSGQAKTLVDQALTKMNRDTSSHDEAMAEAKDMRSFERAAMARWMAQNEKPPKNMHDNWQQWGSIASIFALMGPLFGKRSATAALNAAGDMMQAANAADQHTYDQAYKQWKDHNDSMLKAVELFHGQYREIIEADNKSWDHKQAEITTLLTAAGVVTRFDEQTFARQEQAFRIAKERADLTKAQNEDSEIRLSAEAKNQQYRDAHGGEEPPASVRNQNVGEATRERKGTGGISEEIKRQIYSTTYASRIAAGDPPEEAAKQAGVAAAQSGRAPTAGTQLTSEITAEVKRRDDLVPKDATPQEKAEAHHKNDLAVRSEYALATARSPTGQLSDESVQLLAKQYEMGDTAVITALPRGGPGRIQVENQIAKDMRGMDDGAAQIVMNRLRMAEAKAAATTAGRVTVNTEMFAQEAAKAGDQVIEKSKLFTRTNFPKVNAALRAYETNTGDPNVIAFGTAIFSLLNAYGKMSNPTGTGVHDVDKERLAGVLDTKMSQDQIEAAVAQIKTEGRIISDAAYKAQTEVLARIMPQAPGTTSTGQTPGAAPAPSAAPVGVPVPAEHRSDKDGTTYKGSDGTTYVKRGDQMVPQ